VNEGASLTAENGNVQIRSLSNNYAKAMNEGSTGAALGSEFFSIAGDTPEVQTGGSVRPPESGTHTTDDIAGALTIDGYGGTGSGGALVSPVMLLGEINIPNSTLPLSSDFPVDEASQIDILNVFDDDSGTDKIGTLTAATITGLNMGPGITYDNLETLEILLGTGKDVIVGDNASIQRTGGALNPRMRVLQGGMVYGEDLANDGEPLVTSDSQVDPMGVHVRAVVVFDHLDTPDSNTFVDDIVAGDADDDMIFGQLGNDTLHGDGQIVETDGAYTLGSLTEVIGDSNIGGDDYIEGNGGDDTIYGGLEQDDIIGGSSTLFGLATPDQRPDGSDTIYGGNGDMLARNNLGDETFEGHARDADMILGDNGNIYRLVGTDGTDSGDFLTFNYDNYSETMNIVPRAAELLDYTPGGPDLTADPNDGPLAVGDIGAPDEIHGESGDDFIYGMKGDDILFSEGQDDDIIGGYGNDWISGGTGRDGVLGDDGRLYTSRNGIAEPLYGISDLSGELGKFIYTPGKIQQSTINVSGELKKTVNLAPFNLDPDVASQDLLFVPAYANDIIYGGLGNDFLHGGAGDDVISGAEALKFYYENPSNSGNVLGFGQDPTRPDQFADYDADNQRTKIDNFLINFEAFTDANNHAGTKIEDGNDVIFGDLGNDWLVGGTG